MQPQPGRRPSRLASLAPQGDGERILPSCESEKRSGPPVIAGRSQGGIYAPFSPLMTGPNRSQLSPLNRIICSCSIGAKSVGLVLMRVPGR